MRVDGDGGGGEVRFVRFPTAPGKKRGAGISYIRCVFGGPNPKQFNTQAFCYY